MKWMKCKHSVLYLFVAKRDGTTHNDPSAEAKVQTFREDGCQLVVYFLFRWCSRSGGGSFDSNKAWPSIVVSRGRFGKIACESTPVLRKSRFF